MDKVIMSAEDALRLIAKSLEMGKYDNALNILNDIGRSINETKAELARLKDPDYILVRKIDLDGLIAAEDNPHELIVVRREDLIGLLCRIPPREYEHWKWSDEAIAIITRLKAALEPRPAPGRSGG